MLVCSGSTLPAGLFAVLPTPTSCFSHKPVSQVSTQKMWWKTDTTYRSKTFAKYPGINLAKKLQDLFTSQPTKNSRGIKVTWLHVITEMTLKGKPYYPKDNI